MNKVLLTGRLTRDPELRALASGKSVTTFNVATNEYAGGGKEKAEFHTIVTWDKLAQVCGQYLGKGHQVAIEGATRSGWSRRPAGSPARPWDLGRAGRCGSSAPAHRCRRTRP